MKILFYDIRKIEFEYLTQNMPSFLEPYFINYPLNETTYIDEKILKIAFGVFLLFISLIEIVKLFKKNKINN